MCIRDSHKTFHKRNVYINKFFIEKIPFFLCYNFIIFVQIITSYNSCHFTTVASVSYTHLALWHKATGYIFNNLYYLSLPCLLYTSNHKTKNPTDAEISTEAVPRSEDITFNIVTVTEDQSETTTEEKHGFFDRLFGGNDNSDDDNSQNEVNRTTDKKTSTKPKDKVVSGSRVRN